LAEPIIDSLVAFIAGVTFQDESATLCCWARQVQMYVHAISLPQNFSNPYGYELEDGFSKTKKILICKKSSSKSLNTK
jgi:hypothetical protein